MGREEYSIKPKKVKEIDTPYRRIVTPIPVPESVDILNILRKHESSFLTGHQPLVVWDRAEDFQVYDKYGNMWLDWSSGVMIANAGHGRKEIIEAIENIIKKPLLTNYIFPSEIRAKLIEKLVKIAPDPLDKVHLYCTGSESTECALKLARIWGRKTGGEGKIVIISFEGGFHGRTLGAEMLGCNPTHAWIPKLDPNIYYAPFPGDFRCEDRSFNVFLNFLKTNRISPDKIAAVISETYQGGNAAFMPEAYAKELAQWCKEKKVLLILDEVQAGFGRTGKMFGFEHYGIVPDIVCCAKGISSSLPISAVISRAEILDVSLPITSTHGGNPICCAAALANIEIIERERLHERAAELGSFFRKKLEEIQQSFSNIIGAVYGKGLVYALHIVKKGTKEPDSTLAHEIVGKCVEKGLLLFAPVGTGSASIKICPPLIITKEAICDGIIALKEAIQDAMLDREKD